ncbi:DUF6356 family protein (plasmid) [Skermanella rosea]|uniref:DUF6356 family protein n=1 Tax=Skermanella rosea TaxID=1817965 RepID=UPI001933DDCA|nr:DUF6356 family protein [Skermanella rosea]UEM07900.1 DUF6356 family protein [Skermanella rosea]
MISRTIMEGRQNLGAPAGIRLFTDHPSAVGESYLEHLIFAVGFGLRMLGGGLACCVHGVLPFLFVTTGGRTVLDLHGVLARKRAGWIARNRSASAPEPLEYEI